MGSTRRYGEDTSHSLSVYQDLKEYYLVTDNELKKRRQDQIPLFFNDSEFDAIAVALAIKFDSEQLLSKIPLLIDHIKTIQPEKVSVDFLRICFTTARSSRSKPMDIDSFFCQLKLINLHNPALITQIMQVTDPIIYNFYGTSSEVFINEVADRTPSDFKHWFILMQSEEIKDRLQERANLVKMKANLKSITFDTANTTTELELQRGIVEKELEHLINDTELIAAFDTLNLIKKTEQLDVRFQSTMEEIEEKAFQRHLTLQIEAQNSLDTMKFGTLLTAINLLMKRYPLTNNAENTLYDTLSIAQKDVQQAKITFPQFIARCREQISPLKSDLKAHPGWKRVLEQVNDLFDPQLSSSQLEQYGLFAVANNDTNQKSCSAINENSKEKGCIIS